VAAPPKNVRCARLRRNGFVSRDQPLTLLLKNVFFSAYSELTIVRVPFRPIDPGDSDWRGTPAPAY